MGTFLEQAELVENLDFLKRVKIAIKKSATSILGEAVDSQHIVKHEKRHKLAFSVLNSTDLTKMFAEAIVATNTDINLNSLDGDLEFMVATVFDDIAGVKAGD